MEALPTYVLAKTGFITDTWVQGAASPLASNAIWQKQSYSVKRRGPFRLLGSQTEKESLFPIAWPVKAAGRPLFTAF